MSLFRLPVLRKLTSKVDGLRSRLAHSGRGAKYTGMRERRLLIDPLEDRQLLSLTPGTLDDIRVNELVSESPQMTTTELFRNQPYGFATSAQAVAADNDGDFVVAWTRYDELLDANGDPVLDLQGNPRTEANIYARYFTDEVQRIVLPDAVVDDVLPGTPGRFSFVAGGTEVQKITISATYEPFTFFQTDIHGFDLFGDPDPTETGSYQVEFDVDGSGVIDPGEEATVAFNELFPMEDNAMALETALQGIGGALSDATVQAVSPQEYLILFGDASVDANGVPLDQPEIQIDPLQVDLSGFYPAVIVDTVREPVTLANIPVVPNNPTRTASNIMEAFDTVTTAEFIWGPIDFPPENRVTGAMGPRFEPDPIVLPDISSPQPSTARFRAAIEVEVVPVLGVPGQADGTVFDVTFVGISGAQDHPEMVVSSVQDEFTNPIAGATVETRKEPSPEFRVNPAEPDDPNTFGLDKLDQTNAVVAMDADGEFVIAWESDVSNSQNFGSVSDVFARRFTPAGIVETKDVTYFSDRDLDGVSELPVQGVRGLASPHAKIVQLLTFDLAVAAPAQGTFQLSFTDPTDGEVLTSDDILFNTQNLQQTAADIRAELEDLGLENVRVTRLSTSDPYRFQVEYDVTFGTNRTPEELLPDLRLNVDEDAALAALLVGGAVGVADGEMDLLTFRVNQFTTNAQGQPSVGMDDDGNFVIAWAGNGQDISYFNGVVAQRFNRDGVRQGQEFLVNTEDTDIHFDPYVAMSPDGHFVITWSETSDPSFIVPDAYFTTVNAEVYDVDGTELVPQFFVGGGGASAAAFDAGNRFTIAWDAIFDADNIGTASQGVHAVLFDIDGNTLQAEFRANSASLNTGAGLLWPLDQFDATPAMDADGDLVINYSGFGPDVSENIWIAGELFDQLINTAENADLIPYFYPDIQDLPDFLTGHFSQYIGMEGGNLVSGLANNGDVDGAIDEILFSAIDLGATEEQVGRLRAILDRVAGLMRGEANGVMFSRFDADVTVGSFNPLFSDSIINAHRDGHAHREIIALDQAITGGDFTLRVVNGNTGFFEDVTVAVAVFPNTTVVDPFTTAENIDNALEGATVVGVNWPEDLFAEQGGPIDVRVIAPAGFFDPDEVVARTGTPWELDPFDFFFTGADPTDYIFEVTFQGEVHDSPMGLFLAPNGSNLTAAGVAEVQILTFPTGSGWLALSVGGGNTSGDFFFDSANPFPTAGAIQNQLVALGFAGTTVQFIGFDFLGQPQYAVTFGGASAGVDQPDITQQSAQNHAAPADPIYTGPFSSTDSTLAGGNPGAPGIAVPPDIVTHTYGDDGEEQSLSSISMEPDGDFVSVWTHFDEYTDTSRASENIFFRRFNETTDTAGPQVTDLVAPNGDLVDDGDTIVGGTEDHELWNIVLTFDEDMLRTGDDAVTNPENYRLLKNGVEIVGGIVGIDFGMSRAADLDGTENPFITDPNYAPVVYDLDSIPSNKWEAVFTLDGNGELAGQVPLGIGTYQIQALAPDTAAGTSGLKDRSGNPLGRTGFDPDGFGFTREFVVLDPGASDNPIEPSPNFENGRTHPETPGAVAVDQDGDHVVVFTAVVEVDHDGVPATPAVEVDRIFAQLFNSEGDPVGSSFPVTTDLFPSLSAGQREQLLQSFADAGELAPFQRFGSVAIDEDGDFAVTWTQYEPLVNEAGTIQEDPVTGLPMFQTDIYGRRFTALGEARAWPVAGIGTGSLRLNTTHEPYEPTNQKWSNVDMDDDGDFVVTWSSYGQEDLNQLGTGYGVYARRFDSSGQPLAPEFLVNVTTGGNQQFSNVAVDNFGGFVIAWTSDQRDGQGDIIAREFSADGTSQQGPLTGEIIVNATSGATVSDASLLGDQRYPDIDMRPDGQFYAVTWASAFQDGSGDGVYAKLLQRQTGMLEENRQIFPYLVPPQGQAVPDGGFLEVPLDIDLSAADFAIDELNVRLTIDHPDVDDLIVLLIPPDAANVLDPDTITLADTVPDGAQTGPGFSGTIFSDAAIVAIDDFQGGAVPPFSGPFAPEESLATLTGQLLATTGTPTPRQPWRLHIIDTEGADGQVAVLREWSLDVLPDAGTGTPFLVNSTIIGDQTFPSVAMAHDGGFVVTWSGRGSQPGQEDEEGSGGVFYQQYSVDATKVGGETRVNGETAGNQWIPSVDMDGAGNFVIAYTGVDPQDDAKTAVFSWSSRDFVPAVDQDGPMVTDVFGPDGRLLPGDAIAEPLSSLTFAFGEELNIRDEEAGLNSVYNPNNWALFRNGTQVANSIASVTNYDGTTATHTENPATGKFEAIVNLDGNGLAPGQPALAPGNYVLLARDHITDGANALDGDLDGFPGTDIATAALEGFAFRFTVVDAPRLGAEFRINDEDGTLFEQRFGQSLGTGLAAEQSTRSVAVDHDGDFAVVWTSYGEDGETDPGQPDYDPNAAVKGGVYLQLYNRNNEPLFTDGFGNPRDFQVNTHTQGHQRNAAVAMDADGDFVVVWESEGQDPDGTWGIYARRFDAAGNPLVSDTNGDGEVDPDEGDTDGEFRVNTVTPNDQVNPAVAMDYAGNFVIVWATGGQSYSFYNDIRGRLYNFLGDPVTEEFQINQENLPGTSQLPGSSENNPAVAMDPQGRFVVAWDQVVTQRNGEVNNTIVVARRFDASALPGGSLPLTDEFQVSDPDDDFLKDNEHTALAATSGAAYYQREARNPQVATDALGNFTIAWEAYQDNDVDSSGSADSYGVYFKRFAFDFDPADDDADYPHHQANLVITTTGAGTVPDPAVNGDKFAFSQVNPSLAIDADGDYALVWNGNGAQPHPTDPQNSSVADADSDGVWVRNFHAGDPDDAGQQSQFTAPNEAVTAQRRVNRTEAGIQQYPSIGMEPDGDMIVVWNGRGIGDPHGIFARRFDEPTDTAGPIPSEIRLPGGQQVTGLIGLADPFEVVGAPDHLIVVFNEQLQAHDGWSENGGGIPFDPDVHNLDSVENPDNYTILRDGVEDPDLLDIESVEFTFNPVTNKWEARLNLSAPLRRGQYEVQFFAPAADDPNTVDDESRSGLRDVVGNPIQLGTNYKGSDASFTFDIVIVRGDDDPVSDGSQTFPDVRSTVAMDSDGDYVVVWTEDVSGDERLFFRLYEGPHDGQPAGVAFSPPTQVTPGLLPGDQQRFGTVDVDADGDFVVTWTNYDATTGDADIWARRFFADGTPRAEGPFRVNDLGAPGELSTVTDQKWSDVAVDPDGDFVITWSSYGQEHGQAGTGYGVYARRYNSFATPLASEFQVNVTYGGQQRFSSIDIADNGRFVITWTSDENGIGDDIIARVFEADGRPIVGPLGGEYLVNNNDAAVIANPDDPPTVEMDGNQRYSDVAITARGDDFVTTWTSTGLGTAANPDGNGDGVFGRTINIPLLEEQTAQLDLVREYEVTFEPPVFFNENNTFVSTLDIPSDIPLNNFTIADVDVIVDVRHTFDLDVEIHVISPANTSVVLVENRGGATDDFIMTRFNDEGTIPVAQGTGPFITPGTPPTDGYIPDDPVGLRAFDGERSSGTWTFVFEDDLFLDSGFVHGYTLILTRTLAYGDVFRVADTVQGNQQFASLAANRSGGFTVAWNGIGDQNDEEDFSGGVFFRQFDIQGNPIGPETRANATVAGNQRFASADADGQGNFSVVWTGPDGVGGDRVFKADSDDFVAVADVDGPVVGGVQLTSGEPLFQGSAIQDSDGLNQLVVTFSEELSARLIDLDHDDFSDGPGPDSVYNPTNWVLERNGNEVPGAIQRITDFRQIDNLLEDEFQRNPVSRKYEAIVTFDPSAFGAGNTSLPLGDYVLTVRDTITDDYSFDEDTPFFTGNKLDGDLDGDSGTSPTTNAEPGYRFEFHVVPGTNFGQEFPVPGYSPQYLQTLATPAGTGYAREQTNRSVAVDHDGDYVVTWTSYGEDGDGAGVYFSLWSEEQQAWVQQNVLVNAGFTGGEQRNASVAMDADGDFVIVWEARNEIGGQVGDNPDGSWGVYGQRFNALGNPLPDPANPAQTIFALHTHDPDGYPGDTTGDQLNPTVAMDDVGNFVVAWADAGQAFSYFNDVRAQLFDFRGERVGGPFVVNSSGLPGAGLGPGNVDVNPSAAMDDEGNFVIVWDQIIDEANGVITDSAIMARLYDRDGAAQGPEFQADTGVGVVQDPEPANLQRTARNPQVTMDEQGNFIVVWESYTDPGYDVFFQQFDADGQPVADGQINQPEAPPQQNQGLSDDDVFNGDQVNASVAVDADGDFAVVFNGKGARPDRLDPQNLLKATEKDDEGVFIRNYLSTGAESSEQSRVNRTQFGIQQFGSIAMTPAGDRVVVWSGAGIGDPHGIFTRRYDEPSDTAGPLATELRELRFVPTADYPTRPLVSADQDLFTNPPALAVVFDEEMLNSGPAGLHSITNPNNWALIDATSTDDQGVATTEIQGAIQSIAFAAAPNPNTNKWEAIVTFAPSVLENGGLRDGRYILFVRNTVEDAVGNPLGRTGIRADGLNPGQVPTSPSGGFGFLFRINSREPGDPGSGDADPQVNSLEHYNQNDVAIARAPNGTYVVVWAAEEPQELFDEDGAFIANVIRTGNRDIYARMFDANDRPIAIDGDKTEFRVNNLTAGDQFDPDVAIDPVTGNFVVVWTDDSTSLGQGYVHPLGDNDGGVFAQRFDALGHQVGGEFRVNDFTVNVQDTPAVAMDGGGNIIVAFSSHVQNNPYLYDDVYARVFNWNGVPQRSDTNRDGVVNASDTTNAFRVNTDSLNRAIENDPEVGSLDIAANAAGNFVVTWVAYRHPADNSEWGIRARRFNLSGVALGGEFLVNTYKTDDQVDPHIAMDQTGNFVIVWSSFNQERNQGAANTSDYGIYAQRFNAAAQRQGGEFRVNDTTEFWQWQPDVAMVPSGVNQGDFVITWTSFGQDDPPPANPANEPNADDDNGIFARMYYANGSDFSLQGPGGPALGEFRVNATTEGDQEHSAVAYDGGKNYTVVWTGPEVPSQVILTDSTGATQTFPTGTGIFSRLIDPPGEEAAASPVMNVPGTGGADTFEFRGGASPANWTVIVNGSVKPVPAGTTSVVFDGLGGNDKVILTGTAADESLDLFAVGNDVGENMVFTGIGYTVSATRVETVEANMAGGTDTAIFYDSPGDDYFESAKSVQNTGSLTGPGFSHAVSNTELMSVFATHGGFDLSVIYDTPGDDKYVSRSNWAKIEGNGTSRFVKNFDSFFTVTRNGGNDTAYIWDTPGDDTMIVRSGYVAMKGDGDAIYRQAKFFENVNVYGSSGGHDTAWMWDTAGDDLLVAGPLDITMTGPGYTHYGRGFETVYALARNGGNDRAEITDSDQDDAVNAYPTYTTITRPGYLLHAEKFDSVEVSATAGGNDTAMFYDSAGNDTYTGTATLARMLGTGYSNTVNFFETAIAVANAGGIDTASLSGTAGSESLTHDGVWTTFTGTGFKHRTKFFEEVQVDSAGGTDDALVKDAVIEQGLTHSAYSADLDYLAWLLNFEQVRDQKNGSTSDVPIEDTVFTAYWS